MKNHLKEYLANKDEFEEEFIEFLEENEEGVVLPMDRLKGIYFQVKTKRNKKGEIYKRQIFTTAKGRYEILSLLKYYGV
ncbi:hypothetical protein [Streptococcus anginosus]|uniref:hypothetical protein n=1 Tax=Streptococcus anginosus TaxID=1328 RepID=UPI000791B022|nr:hypothetical protein [Streptococcus anginosus]KXB47895.1 hypothetical protein HMPREF3188_00269 [Tissierellia bacterium KA00581]MCW1011964.1 hypothetical protein [Streptococcus anginosus]